MVIGGTAIDAVIAAHRRRRRRGDALAGRPLRQPGRSLRPAAAGTAGAAGRAPGPRGRSTTCSGPTGCCGRRPGAPQRDWLAARGLGDDVLRANRVGADPGRRFLPRPEGAARRLAGGRLPGADAGRRRHLPPGPLPRPAGRPRQVRQPGRPPRRQPSAGLDGARRPGPTGRAGRVRRAPPTRLVAAQAGFRTVGVLGAAYPDERVADGIAAARHPAAGLADTRVVVCFDDDPAGRAGGARLAELLRGREIAAVSVTPPNGLDVTSWAAVDPAWYAVLIPSTTHSAVGTTMPPRPTAAGRELGLALGGIG